MRKINNIKNLKPFSYSSEKQNNEFNKKPHRKNPSLSNDKIYFFRTSLFTEKSKTFIQKLSSCEKSKSNFNFNSSTNDIMTPKINNINKPPKTSIKLKKGKIIISHNKNKSEIEEIPKYKEINDEIKNHPINKSSNDLVDSKVGTSINNRLQNENKNLTMDKKESNNIINSKKNNNIVIKNLKNIKNVKKEKILSPLTNLINTNNNKKTIVVNYNNQSHSIINLANANSKKKILNKENHQKIESSHKIKYRLKSQNSSNKNQTENKKIISFGPINNQNLKNLKPKDKHYNMKSFSIFDENHYISRYKLGNFYAKKNSRYGNIHNNNININNHHHINNPSISNEKLNSKRKIQNALYRKNIFI